VRITIHASKTDQEQAGAVVGCRTATRCFLCGWQEAQRDPERFVSEVLDFCAMAEDDGRRYGNGKWWDALAG
jgi:hypothetical protein